MNSEVTEDTIVAALEEFCKNDTNSLHMAEDYLLNVMKNPDNLIIFFSIIEKSYPDSVRQLSGLLCRQMLFPFYSKFDLSSRENMKHFSVDLLHKEKKHLVKKAICGIVSAIAKIEVPQNGWNEMKDIIISCLQSEDWQDRECGILLLFSISEYVFNFYDVNTLNQVIIAGFQDSSPDVVNMTVKAATSIFTQAIVSKTVKDLIPSIQYSIELIPVLMNNHCEECVITLFDVYTDIVVSKQLPDEIILSLMKLCLSFLQSEECPYDIKQPANTILDSSIRCYSSLLIEHKLVTLFIKTCIEHLSDGVTEIEDDDEESPASLYELLLDQIASVLPCDMVYNEVIQLSSNQLGSPSWQQRRSALVAMLVIIEYTSDIYRPSLSTILAQMRPLLFDPVRVVRRKAAFFFSEIADYCSSVFIESAPFIQEDIQKLLSTNDEYDITSVMYILECCSEIYEGMNQEGIEVSMDTLLNIIMKAKQLHTQSLALSCLYTIIESVHEKSESRIDACIEVSYRLLLQPYTSESNAVHEKSLHLLGVILRCYGIERLQSVLRSVLESLYQLVTAVQDFDVYSLVFPFISVVATKAQDSAEVTQYLDNFVPILKNCVFHLSIYVEVKVPSATKEYGSMGGSFSVEQRSYRLVHVDANRVQCKSLALDAYLSLCERRVNTQVMIEEETIDRLTDIVVFFCQNGNAVMHTHGNRGAVTLIRIIKMNEQLKNPEIDPCRETTNPVLRYSLVFLHLFRVQLEKERDEDIAVSMIESLYLIGLIVGPRFYIDGFKELDSIITSAFKYNLLSEEEYIDETSYDILHDECPVVTQAIELFGSMFLSFPEVASVLTVEHCLELWNLLKIHLIPDTDGVFLAHFFHLASIMLEHLQSQACFLATDLINLLSCSLQNPNESCRGEAFRCLGWICQIFPDQMSGMIDSITNCILEAMERRQGDSGEAADLATSALNRILKNVMDSPKQKLFVNVLTHLPPLKDVSETESVYKTLFDMYENKGEMFNQFAQPLVNAFVRSLMNGHNLSNSIKDKIKHCLLSMYQENPQAFTSIINTFSPEEIGFVTNLFSSI